MYCPKCGSKNIQEARFCRVCGVNLSLVIQAITGQLNETRPVNPDKDAETKELLSFKLGIKRIFLGLVFLMIAFTLLESSGGPGVLIFIPAFIFLRKGIKQVVRVKRGRRLPDSSSKEILNDTPPKARHANYGDVRARSTGELVPPPPSVTENTTRLLEESQTELTTGYKITR